MREEHKINLTAIEGRTLRRFLDMEYPLTDERRDSLINSFIKDVKRNRAVKEAVDGWLDEVSDTMTDDEINIWRVKLIKAMSSEKEIQILVNGQLRFWKWNDKEDKRVA